MAEPMPESTLPVGQWTMVTRPSCNERYPHRIHFQEGGIYTGTNELQGSFTEWDAGTYRVIAPGKIEISVANDALITHDFSTTHDRITFRDADGCEFQYRRSG